MSAGAPMHLCDSHNQGGEEEKKALYLLLYTEQRRNRTFGGPGVEFSSLVICCGF